MFCNNEVDCDKTEQCRKKQLEILTSSVIGIVTCLLQVEVASTCLLQVEVAAWFLCGDI